MQDFTLSNQNFDFAKVSQIDVSVDGPAGADTVIQRLVTTENSNPSVPEPCSMLIMLGLLGGTGLVRVARRRLDRG